MHVLVLADHCNPLMASTPFFGYQICKALSGYVEHLCIATQVRNRRALEQLPIPSAEVHFIDSEYVARPLWSMAHALRGDPNKAQTLNVAFRWPAHLAFEWEAWRRFARRLARGHFDIIHRVTPLSPVLPSPMAHWTSVPFVLGPINGALAWPKEFRNEFHREREWLRYLRCLHKLLPYYRTTYQRAAAVLAGFAHTVADLPVEAHRRCLVCPDVGFQLNGQQESVRRTESSRMTVLFAGRLVPYKCPDVVVQAFAISSALRQHRLILVGDGPERARLESLIKQHRLDDCVHLLGWQPHHQVIAWMRRADVFAFPSIRELGAGVVLEAMGCGLPVVVVDYGAPGAYVAPGRGIKIPLSNRARLVEEMARTLARLASEPEERLRLGRSAQQYVRACHTWDVKAQKIVQVYQWVLGARSDAPDFFQPL